MLIRIKQLIYGTERGQRFVPVKRDGTLWVLALRGRVDLEKFVLSQTRVLGNGGRVLALSFHHGEVSGVTAVEKEGEVLVSHGVSYYKKGVIFVEFGDFSVAASLDPGKPPLHPLRASHVDLAVAFGEMELLTAVPEKERRGLLGFIL